MLKGHTWEQYQRLCGHTMRLVFVRRRCESTWMITKQEDWGCTFSATPCQSRLPPLCKRASAWRQQISPTAAVALCSIQMPWATLQIDNQLPARGAPDCLIPLCQWVLGHTWGGGSKKKQGWLLPPKKSAHRPILILWFGFYPSWLFLLILRFYSLWLFLRFWFQAPYWTRIAASAVCNY